MTDQPRGSAAACTCHTVWVGQEYGPCPVHAGRMTQTQAWLDENHPESYEIEGERFARCATCEEWSPCRVRSVFIAFDQAIKTLRGSIAWLDGNNLTHINEDRFLGALPAWWDGLDE